MSKAITVFTPTYNRAYILSKCYESLNKQTCKDFEWLIIDDGSTDNTKQLVESWQAEENGYVIRYIYKENGGLHTGYNTAIAHMNTEISVCIDSDDAMPANGIEIILDQWSAWKNRGVAGLIGLDYDTKGNLIGEFLPEVDEINAATLLCTPTMGDKKYVIRNDLLQAIAPMPVFSSEKYFNPHYFVIRLSRNYTFHPVNQCFCEVEYQPDGMSSNMYKQYINSPCSYVELRKAILQVNGLSLKYRFKTAIHYVSSNILAKNKAWLRNSPAKVLTLFAVPAGVLLSIIIRRKGSVK